jgi:ATP-dependent Clp protease ATP-binding subunit ClpA
MNVTPNDKYEDVNRKVREEIDYHFRAKLGRPELLNRLGDNIVIFDFIKEDVAEQIFKGVVDNIFARVARVRGLELHLADEVRETLLGICTSDLSNGGRGIGNKLESALVNPLARELFATSPPGPKVTVSAIRHSEGKYWLTLE